MGISIATRGVIAERAHTTTIIDGSAVIVTPVEDVRVRVGDEQFTYPPGVYPPQYPPGG